jgi:hypothetical protein
MCGTISSQEQVGFSREAVQQAIGRGIAIDQN